MRDNAKVFKTTHEGFINEINSFIENKKVISIIAITDDVIVVYYD